MLHVICNLLGNIMITILLECVACWTTQATCEYLFFPQEAIDKQDSIL